MCGKTMLQEKKVLDIVTLDQFNDVFWRMVAQTVVVASCSVNPGEWDPLNLNLVP